MEFLAIRETSRASILTCGHCGRQNYDPYGKRENCEFCAEDPRTKPTQKPFEYSGKKFRLRAGADMDRLGRMLSHDAMRAEREYTAERCVGTVYGNAVALTDGICSGLMEPFQEPDFHQLFEEVDDEIIDAIYKDATFQSGVVDMPTGSEAQDDVVGRHYGSLKVGGFAKWGNGGVVELVERINSSFWSVKVISQACEHQYASSPPGSIQKAATGHLTHIEPHPH